MVNVSIPRGVRNNNPLNIRYNKRNRWFGRSITKKDKAFEEFSSPIFGFRAAFLILHKYMTLYKLNTIFQICARWAPVGDGNDVVKYADTVSARTGIDKNRAVAFADYESLISIVEAMSYVECGQEFPKRQIVQGYILAARRLIDQKILQGAIELSDKLK